MTGGAGFIGAHLVTHLVRQGHQVRTLDNLFRGSRDNYQGLEKEIETIEGDIREPSVSERAVQGMDVVYHLAFINGTEYFYTKPDLVLDVGVRGTMNIIDACKKKGIGTFVYASSSEVYQTAPVIPTPETVPAMIPDVHNPRYSYGGAKLIGELLTLHSLPNSACGKRIIFRPHNIYGPAMGLKHVIPELMVKLKTASHDFTKKSVELPIQGDGKETRAFCYVEDAVNAIVISQEKGSDKEIYHVGTNEEVAIRDMILLMGQTLGLDIRLIPGELREGGTLRRCPDISKLQSLGYNPKTNLKDGLSKTVAWYKQNLK